MSQLEIVCLCPITTIYLGLLQPFLVTEVTMGITKQGRSNACYSIETSYIKGISALPKTGSYLPKGLTLTKMQISI